MHLGVGVLRLIGNGLISWAAVVGVLSVIVHALGPWRASEMGRHLMAYMTAIAAVLLLSVVRIIIGDSPWFQSLRLVVFVGVPVTMTWRLVLQLQARRYNRREQQ